MSCMPIRIAMVVPVAVCLLVSLGRLCVCSVAAFVRQRLAPLVLTLLDDTLARAERRFPLVPELAEAEKQRRIVAGTWQPTEVYYFTDDASPRRVQRWRAVLSGDARQVSFWRKRTLMLQARHWADV